MQIEANEPGDIAAPVDVEMDSHVSALAELRLNSKQTLRDEKENLAHLLRKAVGT